MVVMGLYTLYEYVSIISINFMIEMIHLVFNEQYCIININYINHIM